MLDAFIIERIRRERQQRDQLERERLELPLEQPDPTGRPLEHRPDHGPEEVREGGAVIVDFTI